MMIWARTRSCFTSLKLKLEEWMNLSSLQFILQKWRIHQHQWRCCQNWRTVGKQVFHPLPLLITRLLRSTTLRVHSVIVWANIPWDIIGDDNSLRQEHLKPSMYPKLIDLPQFLISWWKCRLPIYYVTLDYFVFMSFFGSLHFHQELSNLGRSAKNGYSNGFVFSYLNV
jgi:hypothetical protein